MPREDCDSVEVAPLGMTTAEFRKRGKEMIDFIADYYSEIEKYPVRSEVKPGYLRQCPPMTPPEHPENWKAIADDVNAHILPGISHFQSPRFHAFFPAGSSYPSMLADMLSNAFNVIGFNWINSPALTELESLMMDWLVDLLGLPAAFKSCGNGGGVIQSTSSEATLIAVLSARDKILKCQPGLSIDQFTVYVSDQGHTAFTKAFKLAGISAQNVRVITTTAATEFSLCEEALEKAIQNDVDAGLRPIFIGATLGTTAATFWDRLDRIGPVAKRHDVYLHVDAAYAGSAFVCTEHRHMLKGIDFVDSFVFNPHKWMLVNFDCSCYWVIDRAVLNRAMGAYSEIFDNPATRSGIVTDYRNWTIPLGRRFRALKLWFIMRSFGASGLRKHIRRHCDLAQEFEAFVRADGRFEIMAKTHLGLVCFRLICEPSDDCNDVNRRLVDAINLEGTIFLVQSLIGDHVIIRFALCSPLTNSEHVETAFRSIQRVTTTFLQNRRM